MVEKPREKISNELYYAQKDCPNYSQFGTPLLKDENGRYYKLAYNNDNIFSDKSLSKSIIKNGLNGIKFYVKIPKGSRWYNQTELMKQMNFYFFDDLNDRQVKLRVESAFKMRNSKTGYVYLNGNDLIKLFIYSFFCTTDKTIIELK
jgi:hypothetical protein